MAQEQQSVEPAGVYEEFVIVAVDTFKLYREATLNGMRPCTKFGMNLSGFEWECMYSSRPHELFITCNNHNKDIRFEIYISNDKFEASYSSGMVMSTTRFNIGYSKNIDDNGWKFLVLNIRVLKRRSALPDFTSKHVKIGKLNSNYTLCVGGQTFYVNKELLCMYSDYFDRMFNGHFVEAKKPRTELTTECADPKLFHGFLLFTMVHPAGGHRTRILNKLDTKEIWKVLALDALKYLESEG